ncbi:hypothetical protein ACLKA7_008491 [Drosophila subpalustris]
MASNFNVSQTQNWHTPLALAVKLKPIGFNETQRDFRRSRRRRSSNVAAVKGDGVHLQFMVPQTTHTARQLKGERTRGHGEWRMVTNADF